MKILHVVHGYHPSIGGSQWLVQNLSERFVQQFGDQVTVFTTTALNMELFWDRRETALPAGVETINGVQVRRFPVYNRFGTLRMLLAHGAHRLHLPLNDWLRTIYNGPIVFGLRRAIAESGADVVFATAFPHLHMYDALHGARRAGIPLVFSGGIHAPDRWGYDRPMIYRAIRQADAYIAYTSFERDYLIGRGIAPIKIAVVGVGVDAAAFAQADGPSVRQQYGWGDDPLIALVAKQSPRKRFDLLVEAMANVWQTHPNARLLLAGARTSYSEQIRVAIARLPPPQQAQVTLLDDFPEALKPDLLAASDIFVLPSGQESFGIAFLEAWASGTPVIGCRSGAISSVIDEGRDGLLVPYGDAGALAGAIVELLDDPSRRTEMGRAGRHKVLANYTWEIIANRVRAVYERAIAGRAADGSR